MKSKIAALLLIACGMIGGSVYASNNQASTNLTQYIDQRIGTGGHGHVFLGANVPFGYVQLGPSEHTRGWDWCSGYHDSDSVLIGFGHQHMSGTGIGELGDVAFLPVLEASQKEVVFSHANENVRPGYYAVKLQQPNVWVELTATKRAGFHRYTFGADTKQAKLILDLFQGIGWDSPTDYAVDETTATSIAGHRFSTGWAKNQKNFFVAEFSQPVTVEPLDSGRWMIRISDVTQPILIKVGLSAVSIANAKQNLKAEIPDWDFRKVVDAADEAWNEALAKVKIETSDPAARRIFYTSMYHSMIAPSVFSDVNGEYRGADGKVYKGDFNNYTTFSLWDTYRNLSQLQTLLFPDRQEEMVRSMIDMYKEWGWMPKWELYGRETWTMEGDPSIPIITDTYLKGLRNFDIETAYKAFHASATLPGKENKMRPDIDWYYTKGYIPMGMYEADLSGDNSVSHALEYYVADNALSLLAQSLGKTADSKLFRQRSLGYKHYYSKESGTLRPILKDGSFLTPFNPEDGADFSNAPGFHEGSAWNYTFYVPHDVQGLVKLMGGQRKFIDKLQMVFDKNLYDPANEPDIAYPYLFSYFKGEEWRTQKTVAELLKKYYSARPDGIPGNDDCGTMSTWAIFAMLGFYPDCPGSPYYTLTTPAFSKVTLHLDPKYYPQGDIVIETDRTSPSQLYINSMTLGGKKLNSYRISHKQLVEGKTLKMTLKK